MIRFDPERKTVFEPFDLKLIEKLDKCLMIFDDEVWEDFVLPNQDLKTFPVTNAFGRTFDTYRYIEINDKKILLVYPTMGAAGAVCDMENLIASGIKNFVAFGTCGRLDKNIAKNTIILPTAAFREEGTSYHYLPDADEIDTDKASLDIARKIFSKNGFTTVEGKIWTTDAVYRETLNKIKLMKERSCIGVDMELSALLALAEYRSVKFTEFLIGEDSVDGEAREPLERDNEKIFNTAVSLLDAIR